nr:uncharacterized protein LOC127341113 isoform X2 [Lolium perenne]
MDGEGLASAAPAPPPPPLLHDAIYDHLKKRDLYTLIFLPNFLLNFFILYLESFCFLSSVFRSLMVANRGVLAPRFCQKVKILNLGANTPWLVSISDLKTKERKQKLSRYRMKKFKRKFGRKIKEGHGKQPAKNTREVRQDAPWRHGQAEEVKSWEDHRGCCGADEEDKVVARNYATAELPVKLVVI